MGARTILKHKSVNKTTVYLSWEFSLGIWATGCRRGRRSDPESSRWSASPQQPAQAEQIEQWVGCCRTLETNSSNTNQAPGHAESTARRRKLRRITIYTAGLHKRHTPHDVEPQPTQQTLNCIPWETNARNPARQKAVAPNRRPGWTAPKQKP